ncbi:MAG TPA: AhpC/TSA family protein [Ktedonobacterales bacterium]|nr:AhpC/TSA family protein [Ktedonobacterales bacterium]
MRLPTMMNVLTARDAQLLVFSFATEERLRQWLPFFQRQFLEPAYAVRGLALPPDPFERTRFLADPTRAVYHAYGLGRNAVWRVYGSRILWQYATWGVQGKPIRLNDDALQRGGDFVVGRDERLTLAHTGRDQADRPSPKQIIEALG